MKCAARSIRRCVRTLPLVLSLLPYSVAATYVSFFISFYFILFYFISLSFILFTYSTVDIDADRHHIRNVSVYSSRNPAISDVTTVDRSTRRSRSHYRCIQFTFSLVTSGCRPHGFALPISGRRIDCEAQTSTSVSPSASRFRLAPEARFLWSGNFIESSADGLRSVASKRS